MIITVRLEGVVAERMEGRSFIHSRPVPTGFALLEAFSGEYPIYIISKVINSEMLDYWLRSRGRKPLIYNLAPQGLHDPVEKVISRVRGQQGTVLFHADSDPQDAERVQDMGVPVMLFKPAVGYPKDSEERAWAEFLEDDPEHDQAKRN